MNPRGAMVKYVLFSLMMASVLFMAGCSGGDAGSDLVAPDVTSDAAIAGDVPDVADVSAGSDVSNDVTVARADYSAFGPYPVGRLHVELHDAARDRTLPVEIWYPATSAAKADFDLGGPITDVWTESENALIAPYLENASPCLTTTVHAVAGAEPAPGSWPLVVFSHCSTCTRTSNVSAVERLASHGFAVVAADHVGDTLWDSIRDGTSSGLAEEFLVVRGADVVFLLDTFLDPQDDSVPESVRGRFDPERVAMFGHSFGAVTSGLVTATDARIRGAVLHAAPFAGHYYLVQPETNTRPVFTIVAVEDSMITWVGNDMLREDFSRLSGPAWKAEVADAGHLSFHDLCRVRGSFADCCGTGARQSDQSFEVFEYIDQAESMQIGATMTTAFLAWLLLGDESARSVFEQSPDPRVSVESRNTALLD